LEIDLDDIADAGYLEPKVADAIKQDLAVAGANVIEARYEGATVADAGLSDAMEQIIARLESEITAAKKRHEADEAHIDWLQERVADLSEQLTASRGESAVSRERVLELESYACRLRHELDSAANAMSGLRLDEVKELREQTQDFQLALRDLRFRLLAQHREIESMRVDSDLLRAQLSDTEALLRATHRELVRAREELALAKSRGDILTEDLEEAEAENAVMESWLNDALSRYACLQAELVDATTLCA
jgi:chromosome segregation ATPase